MLVSKEFSGIHPKKINIYIDLYSMFITLFIYHGLVNPMNITSCSVNCAIHYRNYFKKFGVYTNIFLLYSPTTSITNLKYMPEYNSDYRKRILNNPEVMHHVNQNLGLLGTVVPYLPDIYFKIGTAEVGVMAYDIMLKLADLGDKAPSIFVSTSQYAFQLPAAYQGCVLFYKKYDRSGEDLSFSVDSMDCLDSLIRETKLKNYSMGSKNPEYITGYMVLAGLPKRSVKSLFRYETAINILDSISGEYQVINSDTIYEYISKMYSNKNISKEMIENRFKCLDINYQLQEYRVLPESKETSYLNQLNNFDMLVFLNNKYFKDNPMTLDKL